MTKSLKDMAKVSGATLGSRLLGLLRDTATMAYMGIGAVSAAYTISFTLPNLMRRLLGEGALTSALIPIFSQSIKNGSKDEAFDFLNMVATRVFFILLMLVVLGGFFAYAVGIIFGSELRFSLGADYAIILMPYMLLICMAAVFSGALNVLGSFGAPSIGPVVLNIAIIASLFAGVAIFGKSPEKIAYCMCFGWLLGGLFQLGIPAWYLRRKGWKFSLNFRSCSALSELYALFIPAMLGAAVVQVNIFVSKTIAMFLNDSSVPALYLSSRLLELPLGLFTVTIATVYFPKLAMLCSKRDMKGYEREYIRGLVMTMCVTIPATLGLIVLSKDILSLLFGYGVFGSKDIDLCSPVMIACVAGLPFFSLSTFATKGFHSNKDTRTPVKISIVSLFANVALSLILMKPFGAVGLASANAISGAIQAGLLVVLSKLDVKKVLPDIMKICAASLVMGAAAYYLKSLFYAHSASSLVVCLVVISASVAVFFGLLKIMNFSQLKDLKKILLRCRE